MPELRDRKDRDDAQAEGAARLSHYMSSPRFAEHLRRMLPKHMDSDRFYTIALRQLEAVPDLALCSFRSVAGGILQAATLGLEIATMGECWLIPYEQPRGSGNFTAQLQIGYLGYLTLCWRSTQIAGVQVDVVMDGDAFDYQKGTNGFIHHRPARGRIRGERGMQYAYAVLKTVYGDHVWDVFSVEDVERIRSRSPSGNSPAWRDWYPEMSIAKVLKSVAKFAPKSRELARAVALDDEADAGKGQSFDFDVPLLDTVTGSPEARAADAMMEERRQREDAREAGERSEGDAPAERQREPETVPAERQRESEAAPARREAARPEPTKPDSRGTLGW